MPVGVVVRLSSGRSVKPLRVNDDDFLIILFDNDVRGLVATWPKDRWRRRRWLQLFASNCRHQALETHADRRQHCCAVWSIEVSRKHWTKTAPTRWQLSAVMCLGVSSNVYLQGAAKTYSRRSLSSFISDRLEFYSLIFAAVFTLSHVHVAVLSARD